MELAGSHQGRRGLSAREVEVATLVAQGRTNVQIGEALCISPWTVKNHIGRALLALGLRNRAALAAWVARRERAGEL